MLVQNKNLSCLEFKVLIREKGVRLIFKESETALKQFSAAKFDPHMGLDEIVPILN